MGDNSYDGLVEPWKVELIQSRARRLGIRRHDLEDAQQEVILDVLAFRFDPEKANGGTERTALTSLVDRRLMTIKRTKRRYDQRVSIRRSVQVQVSAWEEVASQPWQPLEQADVAMDLQVALASLPVEPQAICDALARGESVAHIWTRSASRSSGRRTPSSRRKRSR